MNILELNFERTWRGGERQTIYNMMGFKGAGHDVSLLCRKGFPLEAKAKAEGFKVFAFSNIFSAFFFLVFRCRRYNLFHAQTSHILTWCVLSKPFHRAKIIFTRRVDFVPHGFFTLWKYKQTDKVIAISVAIKEILEKFGVRNPALILDIIVKKELNKNRALKITSDLNIPAGTRIVCTIGALVPHKDPLTMVEAIKQLAALRNDFVFLHFGNGEMENEVKEKIKKCGLEKVYKMPGFYEDVEDIYAVADVFVMSSVGEGCPNVVLDSFLYRVPVVATNVGGLGDLLANGRGITCVQKEAKKIAAGIDRLLSDRVLCNTLTDTARNYVIKCHSMEYITGQYMEVIEHVMNE